MENACVNLFRVTIVLRLQQLETILLPQDMIQDIYNLHWNIIPKSTGVT